MITTQIPRIFLFKSNGHDVKLVDIDSRLSAEAVLNFYSQTYPQLTTATIQGPEIREDELQFTFVSTIGTKG